MLDTMETSTDDASESLSNSENNEICKEVKSVMDWLLNEVEFLTERKRKDISRTCYEVGMVVAGQFYESCVRPKMFTEAPLKATENERFINAMVRLTSETYADNASNLNFTTEEYKHCDHYLVLNETMISGNKFEDNYVLHIQHHNNFQEGVTHESPHVTRNVIHGADDKSPFLRPIVEGGFTGQAANNGKMSKYADSDAYKGYTVARFEYEINAIPGQSDDRIISSYPSSSITNTNDEVCIEYQVGSHKYVVFRKVATKSKSKSKSKINKLIPMNESFLNDMYLANQVLNEQGNCLKESLNDLNKRLKKQQVIAHKLMKKYGMIPYIDVHSMCDSLDKIYQCCADHKFKELNSEGITRLKVKAARMDILKDAWDFTFEKWLKNVSPSKWDVDSYYAKSTKNIRMSQKRCDVGGVRFSWEKIPHLALKR